MRVGGRFLCSFLASLNVRSPMSVSCILELWSIKVQKLGAFWESYEPETKGGPRAHLPAMWSFGAGEGALWQAALGSPDQEAMQQEMGLERT